MGKAVCVMMVAGMLMAAGCASVNLEGDPVSMQRDLKAYVPRGMSMEEAIQKMEQAGFLCQMVQARLGGTSVDCIRCEKLEEGGETAMRWNIYMPLNDEQKVQDWQVNREVLAR